MILIIIIIITIKTLSNHNRYHNHNHNNKDNINNNNIATNFGMPCSHAHEQQQSDWTDHLDMSLLAPSTYIFFASVIPALTFGEQLADGKYVYMCVREYYRHHYCCDGIINMIIVIISIINYYYYYCIGIR